MTWSIEQIRRGLSPGFGGGRFDLRVELQSFSGSPTFLWVAGDGNTPTIGPALTLVGSVSEGSPIVLASGETVATAALDGSSYYKTASPVDPSGSDDVVIALSMRLTTRVAAQDVIAGTSTATGGWQIYRSSSSTVRFFVGDGAVSASGSYTAFGASNTGPVTILTRVPYADIIRLHTSTVPSSTTPTSIPGTADGGSWLGIGARPYVGSPIPISAGSAYAWMAVWIGNGIADSWNAAKIADFYAKFGVA